MLSLVHTSPTPQQPAVPPPLFCMSDLAEMAEADLFLRLPHNMEYLPENLHGKVMHARRLLSLAAYATALLHKWDDYNAAARNEEAMLKQAIKPTSGQIRGRMGTAMLMRHQAREVRYTATAIFHAISRAEILGCPS